MDSRNELKRKTPDRSSPSKSVAAAATDDGFVKVQKRKQRKLERHRPQFQYDTAYFRSGKKIGIAHIRDLSLYVAADTQKPNWIVVENPSFVSHTVVVLAPGLLPGHLGLPTLPPIASLPFQTTPSALAASDSLPPARVPIIPKLFSYGCPIRAPGDSRKLYSVLSTLLQIPLPENIKKKRDAETKRLAGLSTAERSTPLLYLMTPNQLLENGYKLPSYIKGGDEVVIPGDLPEELEELMKDACRPGGAAPHDVASAGATVGTISRPVIVDDQGRRRKGNVKGEEGWVETPEAKGQPPNGDYPVLAIDCEMCLSEDGQELARVSIVDLDTRESVFDELVRPPKPVVDYLTEFSGMTKERMDKAKHTLQSVQEALITGAQPIITPHTILVGHSLDNDLAVLKIRHPLVIDTSIIYRHARGPPFKPGLKWLCTKWLGRDIQNSEGGHDSEEDARACVDLLAMKLVHGPDFGDPNVDTESIFERLSRHKTKTGAPTRSLVADYGNPRAWYGAKATTAVACTNDDEVVEAVVNNIDSHDYLFARMTELSNIQRWNSGFAEVDMTKVDDEEIDEGLKRFNERLSRIHAALPTNTALIVLTGHSDPRPMLSLAARRGRFEKAYRSTGHAEKIPPNDSWTVEDDRELERVVAETREGMAFFCVK